LIDNNTSEHNTEHGLSSVTGYSVLCCQPKVIVSANCSIEAKKIIDYKLLLDQAIEMSAWKPSACVIYNRKHEEVGLGFKLETLQCNE